MLMLARCMIGMTVTVVIKLYYCDVVKLLSCSYYCDVVKPNALYFHFAN